MISVKPNRQYNPLNTSQYRLKINPLCIHWSFVIQYRQGQPPSTAKNTQVSEIKAFSRSAEPIGTADILCRPNYSNHYNRNKQQRVSRTLTFKIWVLAHKKGAASREFPHMIINIIKLIFLIGEYPWIRILRRLP